MTVTTVYLEISPRTLHCFFIGLSAKTLVFHCKMKSLFFILVILYLTRRDSVAVNKAIFSVTVRERGHIFKEKIGLDLDANSVQYSTPNHLSILESRNVQDFNLGIQLICFPTRKSCYLLKLNREVYPDARTLLQSLATDYRHDGELSFDESATGYVENWYTTGKIFDDLSKFSSAIQDLHDKYGYPVYEAKKMPKGALVLESKEKDIPLAKRGVYVMPCIKRGVNVSPVRKYGWTARNGRDWLTFCKMINGKCAREHIQNRIYHGCLCCPWHQRVSECLFCAEL